MEWTALCGPAVSWALFSHQHIYAREHFRAGVVHLGGNRRAGDAHFTRNCPAKLTPMSLNSLDFGITLISSRQLVPVDMMDIFISGVGI